MVIYIFGNPDIVSDSMPFRLLPALKHEFPDIKFEIKDPNEEWNMTSSTTKSGPPSLIVLDTAIGIDEVALFENLDSFSAVPRVGMHDFDALTNLRYLKKLGKIDKVTIIGVPAGMDEKEAFEAVSKAIRDL